MASVKAGAAIGGSSQVLRCEHVTVQYGALRAINDVSLEFEPGKIHSVIGPNGAGKTTLINVLSGRQAPTQGRVLMGDVDITATAAHERAKAGIGRSFQITKVFSGMTVLENLRLAAQASTFSLQPFWRPVSAYPSLAGQAEQVLEEVGLARLRDRSAELLSHGDQRALELGITMMTSPRILLLDEPLAGVGEREIEPMMKVIERVAVGRTVVLIEHNIDVVMRVSNRVVVMNQGAVLCIGTPDEVRRNAAVREAYLGDENAVT